MEFNLYTCLSDNNVLNKSLRNEVQFEGNVLSETSIIHPVFLINASSLNIYNYMYCVDFERYYFIRDIVSVRTNLWRVSCDVDVLMTYKRYIRQLTCVVAAQEKWSLGNCFFNDGTFVSDSRVSLNVMEFPNGFTDSEVYILTTIGPGGIQTGGGA